MKIASGLGGLLLTLSALVPSTSARPSQPHSEQYRLLKATAVAAGLPRFGEFGYSVAISGPVAVIGAPGAYDNTGAAYIYVRSGGRFRRQASLFDPGAHTGGEFGYAVAVSSTKPAGAIVLVGAPFTDNDQGGVYIYTRSGTKWHREATLSDPLPGAATDFGFAVGVSGTTLIATGPFARPKSQGAAYIYVRSGRIWRRQAALTDPRKRSGDSFGFSAAISNATAVIGSWTYNGPEPDAAYVYVRRAGVWRRQIRLHDPGSADNGFGDETVLSPGTAVISAINNQGGKVYVFTGAGSRWAHHAELANPHPKPPTYFGVGIAISGSRIIVGDGTDDSCGAVLEYRLVRVAWRLKSVTIEPHCQAGDTFGSAVAISGRTALIGAAGRDSGTGAAYYIVMP